MALPRDDQAIFSRTPPQNVDLEMCVLGGIMLEPKEAYPLAALHLSRESFYLDGHGLVFEIMGELFHRGIPPDSTSVLDELRARGLLDKVGGSGVLMGMLNSVPTAASVEFHARKVEAKADARKLIRACTKIIEDCYMQEKSLSDIMDGAFSALSRIQSSQPLDDVYHIGDVLQDEWQKLTAREIAVKAARERGEEPVGLVGLPTGFPTLDKLSRGFRKATVWVVGAPTNHGKSAWMGTVVHKLAVESGVPCAIFSTEMSAAGIANRLLSTGTKHHNRGLQGISTTRLDQPELSDQEWSILTSSYQQAVVAPIHIVSRPMNVRLMRRTLAGMMAMPKGQRPEIIFLDYLQRLQKHPELAGTANSAEKVAANVNAVFDMCIEFNIPVVVLAQYSRAHAGWPKLSDFEGSSAIEKCADVVLFLHRVKEPVVISGQQEDKLMHYYFCIAKARDGAAGDHADQYKGARVPAYYFGEITRFMEAYVDQPGPSMEIKRAGRDGS